MTPHNVITLRQLQRLGACQAQRNKFKALFGQSVEVTAELAEKHAADFSVDWLVSNTLKAPAKAKYDRAMAPAKAKYDRVMAPVKAEYNRVMEAAKAEYDRVMVSAKAEYDRVMAPAWARAFLKQQQEV